MSMTLNLADRLLARGRNLHELGHTHDAARVLGRLARFGELTAPVAEEVQARLGDIFLRRKNYRRARRHLTAALAHQPDNSRYHYLMATALDGEKDANPQVAAEHYRKSLAGDAQQPRCLGEFGLLALRLGQTDEGLGSLRKAVEMAPDDPEAADRLATGLHLIGRADEARRELRAALFRNPCDRRFRDLWNDFQFRLLHEKQQAAREAEAAAGAAGDEPVLLPFLRVAPETRTAPVSRKIIRHDPASPPAPPHTPRPTRLPRQQHAQ